VDWSPYISVDVIFFETVFHNSGYGGLLPEVGLLQKEKPTQQIAPLSQKRGRVKGAVRIWTRQRSFPQPPSRCNIIPKKVSKQHKRQIIFLELRGANTATSIAFQSMRTHLRELV
jgi:hypothetical protein